MHAPMIGKILINKGLISRKHASADKIEAWLLQHPKQTNALLNTIKGFVFFKIFPSDNIFGFTHKTPLTAGYSLAVDPTVVPLGAPVWLKTHIPNPTNPSQLTPFQRLMVAQDTGGAIKGNVRGDVYFGSGQTAKIEASYMKSKGQYWALVPKTYQLKK